MSIRSTERIVHPLRPIVYPDSRVLILGSFPSVISRQKEFYYANPANRFWPVLEAVFGDSAADRTAFCQRHHLALWDVIASCRLHGSSDASITDVEVNPIAQLVQQVPVVCIATTGNKAARLYEEHFSLALPHLALPSTSSANARLRFEDLVQAYQILKSYAEED